MTGGRVSFHEPQPFTLSLRLLLNQPTVNRLIICGTKYKWGKYKWESTSVMKYKWAKVHKWSEVQMGRSTINGVKYKWGGVCGTKYKWGKYK